MCSIWAVCGSRLRAGIRAVPRIALQKKNGGTAGLTYFYCPDYNLRNPEIVTVMLRVTAYEQDRRRYREGLKYQGVTECKDPTFIRILFTIVLGYIL